MIIVYIKGLEATAAEQKLISDLKSPDLRCARFWKGEIEPAQMVYTDAEPIASKYKRRGVMVAAIQKAKRSRTKKASDG